MVNSRIHRPGDHSYDKSLLAENADRHLVRAFLTALNEGWNT